MKRRPRPFRRRPRIKRSTDHLIEPAAVIGLDELREAERDPHVGAFLKKADELGKRLDREGRTPHARRAARVHMTAAQAAEKALWEFDHLHDPLSEARTWESAQTLTESPYVEQFRDHHMRVALVIDAYRYGGLPPSGDDDDL